jgi:hypothetical protein
VIAFHERMNSIKQFVNRYPDTFKDVGESYCQEVAKGYTNALNALIRIEKNQEMAHRKTSGFGGPVPPGGFSTPPEGKPTKWNQPGKLPRP